MKVGQHIAISFGASLVLYAFFQSLLLSISAFLTGFLIDFDHTLDYYLEYGLKIDREFFFESFYKGYFSHIYILFHAWEWCVLLVLSAILSSADPVITGIAVGCIIHMILDQWYNGSHALAYFFFFRLRNRFLYKKVFPFGGMETARSKKTNKEEIIIK